MDCTVRGLTVYRPAAYRIRVCGPVEVNHVAQFGDLEAQATEGRPAEIVTTLAGELADQAALIGLLNHLYLLGLPLLSVECLSPVATLHPGTETSGRQADAVGESRAMGERQLPHR